MDTDSRPKWQRLAKLLAERRARIDPRYATRKVFAEEVGVHPAVLRDIETAARSNYTPSTLAAIEAAYRWEAGSIQLVLDGGDPVEQAPPSGFTPSVDRPGSGPRAAGTAVLSQSAPARRTPRWFISEVGRRGWDLEHLTIFQLRALAEHFQYSLAELLLHADLASSDDLEIDEHPPPPPESGALAEFDEAAEWIASSPFLSRRGRKQIRDAIAKARNEAIKESAENV